LFPPALGTILLILLMGAFFAAAIPVVVLMTGTLFFAGGLVFGRPASHSPWFTGAALLAPFLITSAILIVKFGSPFLIFPALAGGGVASGFAIRRRAAGGVGPILLGALWIVCVLLIAYLIVPELFS
jgi:hypothetical protein